VEVKKSKIFINCEEASFICDKSQYNESTLWERIRLNIRLLYCGVTQKYVKKNKSLTKLVTEKEVVCMPKKAKEALKGKVQVHLQNQP